MKLEKAIEILNDLDTTLPQFRGRFKREAIKLGIEALRRLEKARNERRFDRLGLLPGETDD